ncbi:IS66 family transposase [Clostridium kluyveri]|uniref:Transposase IS66 central domain-containing protein n=1 Tax=Clostridium kluyveri TaxID=1534 RepID=A0A1L5FCR0_CLOKL|nr:hypothetical protein BS101_19895 [Clostridium kluyveri]
MKPGWKKSAPIIEDFIKYVDIEIANALPKSPLGEAFAYSQKLLSSFRLFLTDGFLEIDNNASERCIKSFVLGRKIGFSIIRQGELEPVQLFTA